MIGVPPASVTAYLTPQNHQFVGSRSAHLVASLARFQVFAKLTAKGILGSSPFNPGIVTV